MAADGGCLFFFFSLLSCGRDGPRSGDVRVAPSFVAGALVSSFRRRPESSFALVFGADAKTDSRPCVVCPPSLAASHFLLLAQEKVTKEKGTLAAAVARASMPA